MVDLAAIFGTLQRHHIATPAAPVPPTMPGITWIWAANGIFKRGTNQHLDVLVQTESWPASSNGPGLTSLLSSVRWRMREGRIPGAILPQLLAHAQRAGGNTPGAIVRPIEQQYFVTWQAGKISVTVPPQDATAGHVRYTVPDGLISLVDLHSHHSMAAYFSQTDDRDDQGLSVSVVIGRIYSRPELRCRINCYGHRQEVPALSIFDELGPFVDAGGWYANAHD